MAKDGRSWRIKLRKGVQFHHGYELSKDVVHNHALWCDEKYPGRDALCGLQKWYLPGRAG